MKILDRYIGFLFIKNVGVSALGITLLYVLQSLLTDLINGDYTAKQVLIFQSLQAPAILVQLLPPAILLATTLTLSSLNRNSELVACYSIGMSIARIGTNLILIAGLLGLISLGLQDRVLPKLFSIRSNYYAREMKKKPDFFVDLSKNKIWYRSKNLIYNLQAFDPHKKTILGLTIYDFTEKFELNQVVTAERAVYTQDGWQLQKGIKTVFVKDDPFPQVSRFATFTIKLQERPEDFAEIEKEVDALSLGQLFKFIHQMENAGLDTKVYEVKFHSRFSLSFISLVMCLIGIPFSIRNKREGGLAKDLGTCLFITFFYWLFYSVGLSLGMNGSAPAVLGAWIPTLLFTLFAIILLVRKRNAL